MSEYGFFFTDPRFSIIALNIDIYSVNLGFHSKYETLWFIKNSVSRETSSSILY